MEERVSQPVSGVRVGVGVGGAISAIYLEANLPTPPVPIDDCPDPVRPDDSVGAECVLNGKNVCRVSARLGLS